ncbi:hypothetical protein LY76DRAFT_657759 [Colletotrichum caudatum]|nr:hypothetical protein LY76DRAFT_657759 [Colletotrichum caudatum]
MMRTNGQLDAGTNVRIRLRSKFMSKADIEELRARQGQTDETLLEKFRRLEAENRELRAGQKQTIEILREKNRRVEAKIEIEMESRRVNNRSIQDEVSKMQAGLDELREKLCLLE